MADQDFMKLSPTDQHAYLMDTDPDYKSLTPDDQRAYVQHVTGAARPDFAANPPAAVNAKPPDVMQEPLIRDQAKNMQVTRAAGPYTQPGAAEAAMGAYGPVQTLKDSGRMLASGANFAAPIMTGGASLPVQMATYGATGGAQAAAEGESPRHIIGATALNAAIPAVTELASPLFASLRNAKEGFNTVSKATKGVPLTIHPELSEAALELERETAAGGGAPPQVERKFVQRVTDPTKGPIDYDEARRFASNASRMSAKESMGANPNKNMKRLLGEFHAQLNKAVENQAASAGMAPMHEAAMTEYGQAAGRNRAARNLVKYGKKAAIPAMVGAGAAGAYEALKKK